jgi:hypothetical protein
MPQIRCEDVDCQVLRTRVYRDEILQDQELDPDLREAIQALLDRCCTEEPSPEDVDGSPQPTAAGVPPLVLVGSTLVAAGEAGELAVPVPDPTDLIFIPLIVGGAIILWMAGKPPTYWCTICGGPHGGLFGDVCYWCWLKYRK